MNFFKNTHQLFPFRWFLITVIILGTWLAYADYTGGNILSFNNQQSWSANGPSGQHK